MSAKLIKAVHSGKVVIRKIISGECQVVFKNGVTHTVHNNLDLELTKLSGVSADDCLSSNLEKLITHGAIDVVL